MEVFVSNEQGIRVDEARLSELAQHALTVEGIDGEAELSVLLVTADHIRRLNSRYAGDDHATDVLAFPMNDDEDDDEDMVLGDVVICPEVAQQNASKMEHSLDRELDVLVVHGTLHLLGYDHQGKDDRAAMDRRLQHVLDTFQPDR